MSAAPTETIDSAPSRDGGLYISPSSPSLSPSPASSLSGSAAAAAAKANRDRRPIPVPVPAHSPTLTPQLAHNSNMTEATTTQAQVSNTLHPTASLPPTAPSAPSSPSTSPSPSPLPITVALGQALANSAQFNASMADMFDVEEPFDSDSDYPLSGDADPTDGDASRNVSDAGTHSTSRSRTPTRGATETQRQAATLRQYASSPPVASSPSLDGVTPSRSPVFQSGPVATPVSATPKQTGKLKAALGNLKEKFTMKFGFKKSSSANDTARPTVGREESYAGQAPFDHSPTAAPTVAPALPIDARDVSKAMKAAQKEAARAEREARKRDERLMKEKLKAAADAKKARDLASKNMRQLLEKAAISDPRFGRQKMESMTSELQYMHEDDASQTSPTVKSIELLTLNERRDSLKLPGGQLADSNSSASAVPSPVNSPSSSSALRLGWLHLHIVSGRQINGKDDGPAKNNAPDGATPSTLALPVAPAAGGGAKQKTCLEVHYGGCVYKSDFHAGSNPHWNLRVTIPLYSITTDIIIQVVLKHSLKKNETFGMVVVPLSMVINRNKLWRYHTPARQEAEPTSARMHQRATSNAAPPLAAAAAPAVISNPPPMPRSPTTPVPVSVSPRSVAPVSPVSDDTAFCSRTSSLLASLFSTRDFSFREWISLYPFTYEKAGALWSHRFPAAEDTILASGMDRPKKALGQVFVSLDLKMDQPLSTAYLLVDPRAFEAPETSTPNALPPVPTPSHPIFHKHEEPLDFHKTVMKKNIKRIRRWLTCPEWLIVFQRVFTWKIPILSFWFGALWTYLCFSMPAWQYPLFLILSILFTNLWIVRWKLEPYSYVHTYQQDALPSSHLGEGSWKKFQRYKGVVAKVSHAVGKTATILEKMTNALNFSDVALSIFVYAILILLAAMLSTLFYFVPVNICIFLIGASFFVRGGYETICEWFNDNYPALFTPNAKPAKSGAAAASSLITLTNGGPGSLRRVDSPPAPAPPQPLTRMAPQIERVKHAAAECRRWGGLFKLLLKHLFQCLKYLFRRSPDHYELAHRILCERAITANSPPPMPTHVRSPTNQARKLLFGAATSPTQGQQQMQMYMNPIRPGLNPSHMMNFSRRDSSSDLDSRRGSTTIGAGTNPTHTDATSSHAPPSATEPSTPSDLAPAMSMHRPAKLRASSQGQLLMEQEEEEEHDEEAYDTDEGTTQAETRQRANTGEAKIVWYS